MDKEMNMKRNLILCLFLCLCNGWLMANHWTVDGSDFEDNMTLTAIIQFNGEEQRSSTLEVGAFCGEECRGSQMTSYFPPTDRYVVQLMIFGVAGEQFTFKLYDYESEQELDVSSPEAVTYDGDGLGSLGNPYVLNFIDETPEEENHWTVDGSDFEDNMTLTGIIQFNGEEQHSGTLEVGAFCGEECRGSQMTSYFPPTDRYVVQLTIFGVAGDQFTFKLYDHENGQEVDMSSPEAIAYDGDGLGSLANPYVLNFTTETPQPQHEALVIEIYPGWNWISNMLHTEAPIEAAFANLTPTDGDMVKSQEQFATFNAATGSWNGQLTTLKPGRGLIYLSQAAVTKTFSYPEDEY